VNVLAVLHGTDVPAGTFGDVLAERGHRLETWSAAPGEWLPRPVEEYGCVLVFGGAMHPDEEELHPWLREEDALIRDLLERRMPILGVCLGSQLIAKAAGARVYRIGEPEVGWRAVELAADASDDPLLGRLPPRFDAFQWHFYGHDVPAGGTLLASSRVCTQAFRIGEAAWGVQFHPEVTLEIVGDWVADAPDELPVTADEFLAATSSRIGEWGSLGRSLCQAFLDVAEQVSKAA
jgi:GMP synthase (glutamine-hydrolysing)